MLLLFQFNYSDGITADEGGGGVVPRGEGTQAFKQSVEQAEHLRAGEGTKLGTVGVLICSRRVQGAAVG